MFKNSDSGRIAGYRSMTGGVRTTATVHRAVYRTDGHAISDLNCLSQPAWTTTTKRFELYAAVNQRSTYRAIEATDRHVASRGLSATAVLLFLKPLRWLLFLSASLYVSKSLLKEALIEIGCVVTSLVAGRWLVGCHARALWPNGAS